MRLDRLIHFAPVLGVGLMLAACQNPAEQQRKAEESQATADRDKAQAQQQAEQKISEAQRQAQEETNRAQRKADEEKGVSAADLSKQQAEYRDKISKELASAQPQITAMQTTVTRAAGPTKPDMERALTEVTRQRDVLNQDLQAIQSSTPGTWAGIKAKTEKDLDSFKSTLKVATSEIKVPKPATNQQPPSKP